MEQDSKYKSTTKLTCLGLVCTKISVQKLIQKFFVAFFLTKLIAYYKWNIIHIKYECNCNICLFLNIKKIIYFWPFTNNSM